MSERVIEHHQCGAEMNRLQAEIDRLRAIIKLARQLRETAEVLHNNGFDAWVDYCLQAATEIEKRET